MVSKNIHVVNFQNVYQFIIVINLKVHVSCLTPYVVVINNITRLNNIENMQLIIKMYMFQSNQNI